MRLLSSGPDAGAKYIHKVVRGSILKMKKTKLKVKGHTKNDLK